MNLLAQAFEAIASSSGASKRKTGIELPGLDNFTKESESDAKINSALHKCTMDEQKRTK